MAKRLRRRGSASQWCGSAVRRRQGGPSAGSGIHAGGNRVRERRRSVRRYRRRIRRCGSGAGGEAALHESAGRMGAMGGRWRKRRVAKWMGACASALILAAWGASEFWMVKIELPRAVLFLIDGQIIARYYHTRWAEPQDAWTPIPLVDMDRTFGLVLPKFEWRNEWFDHLVPYWSVFLLAAIPTALLFFLDRRKILPGHCNQCGYDLRHHDQRPLPGVRARAGGERMSRDEATGTLSEVGEVGGRRRVRADSRGVGGEWKSGASRFPVLIPGSGLVTASLCLDHTDRIGKSPVRHRDWCGSNGGTNLSYGFRLMKFNRNMEGYVVAVPYWTLLLISGMPTALLFYRDRRKILPRAIATSAATTCAP